ncbi:MAG TPA: AAA family ATPase [Noviherbaspirillum sp.]|jgi:5-methylcytosine-specific restriction protein B|uniref:AAA family ATPase n=1 Tax=Noviherbaspirillum sp. TaxID=1926288 RepID=UPI002F957691
MAEDNNRRAKFRAFLLGQDYQDKTTKEYARFIDDLSNHCDSDIFAITNIDEVEALVARYSSGPEYDIGNKYNGGPRAAIKKYLAFVKAEGETTMNGDTPTNLELRPLVDAPPPLNQILYGPPGTGKTHNTIDEALTILDPDFLKTNHLDRASLRVRFGELEASGHIRFVTFHQSFSYEDFVEGLRAEPDEDKGQLKFVPVPGVFKSICEDAAVKVVVDQVPEIDLSNRAIWKMSLGNRVEENYIYEECIEQSRILLGWGAGIDFSDVKSKADIITAFKANNLSYTTADYPVTAVNAFVLGMRVGDLVIASDGNSKFRAIGEIIGDYEYLPRAEEDNEFTQSRSVRWLKVFAPSTAVSAIMNKSFMQKAIYRLGSSVIDRAKLRRLLSTKASELQVQQGPKARVLIIDEINRGNISRIFGELITLIEPSKRAGNTEALSVTLPYTKKPFSVPNNLYIIGTMNTADRSLASLDMALRRRFVFKEMPPRPDLLADINVAGVSVSNLLEIMNQRIEALLDREHCLGHAYFLPLRHDNTIGHLGRIFMQQILPLLKEYFFEDWERIGWVLNDHRKPAVDRFILRGSAVVADLFGDDFDGKVQAKTWELNPEAFERLSAYQGIVGPRAAVVKAASQADDDSADYRGYRLLRMADTTVKVFENGEEQVAMPILRKLAQELNVSLTNASGGIYNTRQLGAKVIAAIQRTQR